MKEESEEDEDIKMFNYNMFTPHDCSVVKDFKEFKDNTVSKELKYYN